MYGSASIGVVSHPAASKIERFRLFEFPIFL